MKIGDIIINPWVNKEYNGVPNPNYATIYIGNNKSLDFTGRVIGWADKVYRSDNEREWKVVGHINLFKIIQEVACCYEPSEDGKA